MFRKYGFVIGVLALLTMLFCIGSVAMAEWVRYEENEAVTSGGWGRYSGLPAASGGTFLYSNGRGYPWVEFSFIGSGVRLVYNSDYDAGIADIDIDGVAYDSIDMYSSATGWFLAGSGVCKTIATDLDPTSLHTLTITGSGTKNPNSIGFWMYVDACDVDAIDAGAWTLTRYEAETLSVPTGWRIYCCGASDSGGGFAYAGSSVTTPYTFNFVGTSASLLYHKDTDGARINVSVDSVSIDLNGSWSLGSQLIASGLDNTSHTLTITRGGPGWIYIDAFEVDGIRTEAETLSVPTGWRTYCCGAPDSGGGFVYAGSSVTTPYTFNFVGTEVRLLYHKDTDGARINVGVDSVPMDMDPVSIDLNGSWSLGSQLIASDLANTSHTLIITRDGPGWIYIDAFDISSFVIRPSLGTNDTPIADANGPYTNVLVDIDPDTLNLSSEGKWITVYLDSSGQIVLNGSGSSDPDGDALAYSWQVTEIVEPWANIVVTSNTVNPLVTLAPGDYIANLAVDDGPLASIDIATITAVDVSDLCDENGVLLDTADIKLNGVDADWGELQGSTLMVKFDRQLVAETVDVGEQVEMTISGDVSGTDTIRVIDKGSRKQ